jgi:hypothetical protein
MARDVHPGEIGKTFFLALFCTVNRIFIKTGSGQTQGKPSTHTTKDHHFAFSYRGNQSKIEGMGGRMVSPRTARSSRRRRRQMPRRRRAEGRQGFKRRRGSATGVAAAARVLYEDESQMCVICCSTLHCPTLPAPLCCSFNKLNHCSYLSARQSEQTEQASPAALAAASSGSTLPIKLSTDLRSVGPGNHSAAEAVVL